MKCIGRVYRRSAFSTFSSSGFALIMLLSLPGPGNTTDPVSKTSVIDNVEHRLEIHRHEQLVARRAAPDSKLAPFTTDGCSGGLSVGWEFLSQKVTHFQQIHGSDPPWQSCCVTHDHAYHTAGTRYTSAEESFTLRLLADEELRVCVQETGLQRIPELSKHYSLEGPDVELLYSAIASIMYRAVRIGGVPCSGLPWRWGYGWPECD